MSNDGKGTLSCSHVTSGLLEFRTGEDDSLCIVVQRRPRIRAMLNRSNLLIVQNLISTERNGLSCSKITLLIVQFFKGFTLIPSIFGGFQSDKYQIMT